MASTCRSQHVPAAAGVVASASCLQKAVSRYVQTCFQLPPGTPTAMALPGVVVNHMERYATRLYGPFVSGTCGAGVRENCKPGKMVPTVDCQASDVERRTEPAYFWGLYRRAAIK